jgi:uridine kinase
MNPHLIDVQLNGNAPQPVAAGTTVGALAAQCPPPDGLPWLGALVNNDVASLSYPLGIRCRVDFVHAGDAHGWRIYRHSLCFLLAKAVADLYPDAAFSVDHSFGLGLYCSLSFEGRPAQAAQVKALEARMRDLVEQDVPIVRQKIAYADAVALFQEAGMQDKLSLLAFRNPPHVVLHACDGFRDLAHGPLAPSTGLLERFALVPYAPGFVLHLPDRANPLDLPPFEDQPHLFHIFQEHKSWGRILGVDTVGRLNDLIVRGGFEEFVRTAEALHEKKAARIADHIAEARDRLRVILIAGPSSAGKTTFAKRLAVQLAVNGLHPVTLGTDDYFVEADRTPLDENGHPDFEHLEAVDVEAFNADLAALVAGRTIRRPRFNFAARRREYEGTLALEPDQILVIEGIHGLNPALTPGLPREAAFRIYVSALTQLSVDRNNRISTTDNRLMRRIVRDHRFRGHSALATLRMWPSVRRGEKRWIFPFQREADATFNSALDYELAVLKPMVEPLLTEVKPGAPEYAEARRLSEFLLGFVPAPAAGVPATSILREYIGGSRFQY